MNEWIDESSSVFVKMVREIGLWVRIEREDDQYPCQRSIMKGIKDKRFELEIKRKMKGKTLFVIQL